MAQIVQQCLSCPQKGIWAATRCGPDLGVILLTSDDPTILKCLMGMHSWPASLQSGCLSFTQVRPSAITQCELNLPLKPKCCIQSEVAVSVLHYKTQLFLFCSMQEKHANLLDLVRHGIENVFKTMMKNPVAWVCARYFLTLRYSVVWSTSLPLGQTCLSAVRAHAAATLTLLWGWFLWRVQKQY